MNGCRRNYGGTGRLWERTAFAGCLALASCGTMEASSSGRDSLVDPACLHEAGPPEDEADRQALERELEDANRVARLNRTALEKLETDKRWDDPEQHEGLESAVADTTAMIEVAEANATCLEELLAR